LCCPGAGQGRGVRVGLGAEEVGGASVPDALHLPPLTPVAGDPVFLGRVLGQQGLVVGGREASIGLALRLPEGFGGLEEAI